jgi:glucose-6-phosphate isomerase
MKFNFENNCLLSNTEIEEKGKALLPYLKHLQSVAQNNNYENNEGSINLPYDEEALGRVKSLVEKTKSDKLKYIFDIGIGGSNLGTKAIYDAMFGYFDVVNPDRFPKIIFLDTNDPEFISQAASLLKKITDKEEFLINVISKSGTTTEPLTNFESLIPLFVGAEDRVVVTSDINSEFYKQSLQKKYHVLDLPKSVGGRYSVFSSVGLFPLTAAGVDVDQLLKGARSIRDICLSEKILENPAVVSAVILSLHNNKGKNINDNFIFHPELESIGKWYRQLMGESIGKERIAAGKKESVGITPTVSIGSVDLHSVAQLYIGGPRDKVTTFISAPSTNNIGVPENMSYPTLIPHIAGKSLAEIMDAILAGTMTTYKNQQIPFTSIILDDLSEYSYGEFLQFKMIEMMFLANILGVNAFDQPQVELYKTETKRILS